MDTKPVKLNKKRKGFSLVELVVVMAIIGILIMVMAPNYKGFIDQANTVGIKSDAKTLQTMISLVEVEGEIGNKETTTVDSLLTGGGNNSAWNNLKAFIRELPDDAPLRKATLSQLPSYVKTGTPDGTTTPSDGE